MARKISIDNPVAECQRRITSGDGIWLRDKETATDDLKKLVVDYKIIAESQKFGIAGKSFNACVRNWQMWCRFNLKIPADIIGDYYPPLKNFFALLKNLSERGEIPQGKREIFLCQLIDNAELIHKAISELLKVFRDKYSYQIDGMNEEEIKDLYTSLPNSSFTDSTGRYHKIVSDLATKIKSSQIKNKLLTLWREVAGNKSPREWSKVHRTPILAMVPQSEQKDAKKVFDTVMANSPDEKAVKDAIDYLEKRQPFLAALNDDRQIEEAFSSCVIGEKNRVLLDDNDEVRNELELKFPGDAYQWFPSVRVQDIIEKFAENKYYTGETHDKVTARVMRMSDEDAKKLLIELIDKDYEVGVKLLRES